MPGESIIDIAEVVVTQLNAHAFPESFTAVRGYLATYELPEMDTLKVTVVPKEDNGRLDTRSNSTHEYAIDIGIQKKPATLDNDNLDPLVQLTQQIADFFLFGKRIGEATLISPSIRILYLQDHLHKLRQFTSIITLRFRGWREAS